MTDSGTLLSLIRQVRAQRSSQPDALEGERQRLEGSLIDFVEEAWPFIDAAPYEPNWAIDALCEHLQAVTEGRISRLLINFPPRCGKTIITSTDADRRCGGQGTDLHPTAEAITRPVSDMTNAELAALEARMIVIPASLALEASAGADNAEGEESDNADGEAETVLRR
jgi:hypothetical protein